MNKFLVIQTSFIGDVILATALLEKLHAYYPSAQIDICVRQGNEQLFVGHPFLGKVYSWNKKKNKFKNLVRLSQDIRKEGYDVVVNLQRFASSGFLTLRSNAAQKIGFKKNPLSFFFTETFLHEISEKGTQHEVERNQKLIEHLTDTQAAKPKLYPNERDYALAKKIHNQYNNTNTTPNNYFTISPASVWYTKQLPKEKWVELLNKMPQHLAVFILGGPGDAELANELIKNTTHKKVENCCGKTSLLSSAALMQQANMNYVNDSAPLHLCSAMNAPVTAFFCSTVPAFGFTPLSDQTIILERTKQLACRPCGLHGYKQCPKGHFKCGDIVLPNVKF